MSTRTKVKAVRACLLVASLGFAAMLGAQQGQPDEGRVNAILEHIEHRAMEETDASFDVSHDYPKSIQLLRMRSRMRPHDENILTDLTFLLTSIEYRGEAVTESLRFMKENPDYPDRAYPLAQLYFDMNLFAKVPALLEEDILRTPAPHANTFRVLGHSYRKMGFHKDALRVWEAYLKNNPDDAIFKRLRDSAASLVRIG